MSTTSHGKRENDEWRMKHVDLDHDPRRSIRQQMQIAGTGWCWWVECQPQGPGSTFFSGGRPLGARGDPVQLLFHSSLNVLAKPRVSRHQRPSVTAVILEKLQRFHCQIALISHSSTFEFNLCCVWLTCEFSYYPWTQGHQRHRHSSPRRTNAKLGPPSLVKWKKRKVPCRTHLSEWRSPATTGGWTDQIGHGWIDTKPSQDGFQDFSLSFKHFFLNSFQTCSRRFHFSLLLFLRCIQWVGNKNRHVFSQRNG